MYSSTLLPVHYLDMSGAEAGLALGVLPILISAAEHYSDCLRPFTRYKHFSKQANQFQNQLGIQKVLFRNQCRLLLEDIIDHDVASSMLDAVKHPSWSDIALEERLVQLLGESRSACISIIETIEERLRDIDTESQDLATAIDQDSQVFYLGQTCYKEKLIHDTLQETSDPVGSKQWRRYQAKKFRFSFSKRLDRTLGVLRELNDDFRNLSTQTSKSTSLQSRRKDISPKKPYQEVERYQVIGQASRQVYEALVRACTKHTEHQAHFCLMVEQAKVPGDRSVPIRFNMAYTQMTLASSADQNDLVWFAVDSTSDDAVEPDKCDTTSSHNGRLIGSLKRQVISASDATQKKTQKRVRFQSASSASVRALPTLSTATIANAVLPSDRICNDFCDFIRRRLCEPVHASKYVGVLENTDRCRNFVYPSPNTCCHQMRQAISLGQLISRISKRQVVGGLTLYDRFSLAKTLAIAVLQYHSTPWLKVSWRSEDIYFLGNELVSPQDSPSIASPHLKVKVKGPCGQLSRASELPPHNLARNPLLFSLGVVLLEIAHTSTMEKLQRPVDLDNGREDLYTEFFAARRLAKSAKTDMGPTYHNIVEKVVECDFGCGMDLNDPRLQAAFHHDVICPLERLEQKLHELHFDST